MFTSASCAQLRQQQMLWNESKNNINRPKTTSAPANISPSVSKPKKRDKGKQSADDSKGISEKTLDADKGDFLTGGALPRGAYWTHLFFTFIYLIIIYLLYTDTFIYTLIIHPTTRGNKQQ